MRVSTATSGAAGFHDVTGGVYKAWERIHGAVADAPLLAIPTSRSRVADIIFSKKYKKNIMERRLRG